MEAVRTLTPDAHAELHARLGYLQEDPEKTRKATLLVEDCRFEAIPDHPDHYQVIGLSGVLYDTSPKACSCKARRSPETPYACYHMLGLHLYRSVAATMAKEGKAMYTDAKQDMESHVAFEAPGEPQDAFTPPDVSTTVPGLDGGSTASASPQDGTKPAMGAMQSRSSVSLASAAVAQSSDEDKASRYEISRLLTLYGLKLKTREEYVEAIDTHVGLPLIPAQFPAIIACLEGLIAARKVALPSPKLLEDYMVNIKGKRHVQYGGLLAYAHEQGLVSLTASLTTATPALAIATATATFKDGRTFTETADATPDNVGPQIKPHFMRMALTRAKARALRDALNVNAVAVEELGAEAV